MTSKCLPLLKENGPLLGSELQKHLVAAHEITAVYARKIIERETQKEMILSTKPVHFLHRQFLYYLPGQSISKKIESVLPDYKKSINRVLQSMLHNGGMLLTEDAVKVGAAVLSKKLFKTNETKDELISSLVGLNIIEQPHTKQHTDYLILSLSFRNQEIDVNKQLFSRVREQYVNGLFVEWFVNWLKHQNITGWNSRIEQPTPSPVEFNGQLWDAVCFTYLYGYYRKQGNEKTPSPVLVEAQVIRMLHEEDIEGFVTRFKMQDARYKGKTYGERIMPVILYDQMSEAAFTKMKQEGIMAFQLSHLLGPDTGKMIHFLKNPWTSEQPDVTAEEWIRWVQANNLTSFMPQLFDELHFILAAKPFKEKGYTLKQHITIEHNKKPFTIEWSLLNKDKSHLVIFTSENTNKNLSYNEKEEAISHHFSSLLGLQPEFHQIRYLL